MVCVCVFKAMFVLRERPADGEDKRCWRGQSDLWKGDGPEVGLCTGSSTFHHFWQNEKTKAQRFLVFFSNRLNSAFPSWRVGVAPEEPG